MECGEVFDFAGKPQSADGEKGLAGEPQSTVNNN